jgi:hypothetical protein
MRVLKLMLCAAVLAVAAVAVPAPAEALTVTNFIQNTSTINLGVIHVADGHYAHGNYDALLTPGRNTYVSFLWTTTAGWYTGPGYCTRQWRSDTPNAPFRRQLPDLPAGLHVIGSNTAYQVQAYRC